MPGPYAHITLLYELMRPDRLESIFSPSSGFPAVLEMYFPYCALGAVSPDYPNLARGDDNASRWADAMHCLRACEMIISGIRRVRDTQSAAHDKQLAWLLGYCAHVATDVTIHPVVQAKVGVYARNQRQHRICEMNQDSYIFRRMNRGEIGESDMFAQTVAKCSNPADRTQLDSDIATLWEAMLKDVHPKQFTAHPPDSASWHREFVAMVDNSESTKMRLFPLAGVISAKMGLAYPAYTAVDHRYVAEQMIPSENPVYLHYDNIFDLAVGNVAAVWRKVDQIMCDFESPDNPTFGDWNLDTGRDEQGRLVFW